MKVIIDRNSIELNLIFTLLFEYVNQEVINEKGNTLNIKTPKETLEVYKEIDKNKYLDKNKLEYIFKAYPTDDVLNSYLKLYSFIIDMDKIRKMNVEDFIIEINSLSKEDILNNIILKINYINAKSKGLVVNLEKETNISEEMVLDALDKSNLCYELKWKLYKAIKEYDLILNDIVELVLNLSKHSGKKFKNLMDITINWSNKLEKILKDKKEEFFNIDKELMHFKNMDSVRIIPLSGGKCFNYEYSCYDDNTGIMYVGYNVKETLEKFRKANTYKWFVDVLKLLSDSTRYKILKLLSAKDMYSGELASIMRMAQGNITHHTSILILYDLIESYNKDGKVYYRINKPKIKAWVKMLRESF